MRRVKHAPFPQELPRIPALRLAWLACVGALATSTAALAPLTGCAPAIPASPLAASWNAHVKARPLRTTLPAILGATTNAKGGPTPVGGQEGRERQGPETDGSAAGDGVRDAGLR
jgi:hypothetical protein